MAALKLRIILVEPEQARNIGSVVRVIANFGLSAVTVVQWQELTPEESKDIHIASSGAIKLVNLMVAPTLPQALEGADLVLGTTGRHRATSIPVAESVAEYLTPGNSSANRTVAVVFGRESKGLSTEEIDHCHGLISLPLSDSFPSMNLSHAVAIILYQSLLSTPRDAAGNEESRSTAPRDLQERWLAKVADKKAISSSANAQLRRLLHKASPTEEDMALLFNLLKPR